MIKRVQFRAGLALASGLAALALAATPALAGYSFKTLTHFDYDLGANPQGGVIVVGNQIYGVTEGGGILGVRDYGDGGGVIYSLPIGGGPYTTMDIFNAYTGFSTKTTLTPMGNALYGVSPNGGYGPDGNGTVFSISRIHGSHVTNVATFKSQVGQPTSPLVAWGDKLYGTASGGAYGEGAIYSISPTDGVIHLLFSFDGAASDRLPFGKLLLVGDTLYGGTSGAAGNGTVYAFNLITNTYKRLAAFNGTNGRDPAVGVILGGDRLYGITSEGGANNRGVVFSLPLAGGPITRLATIAADQGLPSELTQVGNMLYWTDKSNLGAIFSVPIWGGVPKRVLKFNGYNGSSPFSGLTLFGSTLYGTASRDGSAQYGTAADPGYGTVYSLTPDPLISVFYALGGGFGGKLGSLSVLNADGLPQTGRAKFTATSNGYAAVSDANWSKDVHTYALHVLDSAADRLGTDLSDVVWELNAATHDGFTVTASRIDPTITRTDRIGRFGGAYNLFITVRATKPDAGPPAFAFDFRRLNGTPNTLKVDGLALSASAAILAGPSADKTP